MILTYKFKFYKNKKNKNLHKTINLCGKAHNHCIALRKKYYLLSKKGINKYKLCQHFAKLKKIKKYNWLKKIPSQSLQDVIFRIDSGYNLFYQLNSKGLKSAPPSFRKVSKYKSFTLSYQCGWKLLGSNKIKIGNHIYKFSKDRDIVGRVISLTIKRDDLNDLYLYFACEIPDPILESTTGKIAGFDFGLKTFLTGYDGEEIFKVESSEFFKQELNNIKKLHRQLSSKKKGSNNRKKSIVELQKGYKRITDRRNDWFYKLANELTDKYDILIFENLNLQGMQRLWGRKVSDLAFATFLDILKWVAKKKCKVVVQIDRYFPSSKTCNNCDFINQNLTLDDRRWRCDNCHQVVDRDDNAAMNIRREGLSSLGVEDIRLFREQSLLIPQSQLLGV